MINNRWHATRLKYAADVNVAVLPENTDDDFELVYIDIGNVTQGAMDTKAAPIRFADAPSRARRLAKPGDSVVSTVRTYLRAVATVPSHDEPLVFSTGFAVLSPCDEVHPQFLSWYLQSDEFVSRVEAHSTGVSYPAITASQLVALDLRLPPFEEQGAIADYLDRETTRIDTLIEEQQRLIELLRERRRALVDAALSQGLDSEAGLSETGSPWIPELPCSWKAVRTKRVLSFGPANGVSPEASDSDDLKSLSLGAIRDGRVSMAPEVTKFVDPSSLASTEALRLHPGDILLVRGNGNVDLVARAGLVGPEFAAEEYIYPDLLIRIRVNSSMLPEFFVWACNASVTRAQVQAQARTAVGTFKVAGGDVRSLVLPLPPLNEQRRIVAYLDEQTAKIDTLIAEAERLIELARERRAALITAAVTGQIDVREMA